MKKMLVGLRLVFRRAFRKVTRLCGRNVAWDLKHPVADSVINALLLIVMCFFVFYPMSCESPVVLSIVIVSGFLIGCMEFSFLKWVGKSEKLIRNAKYWYLWVYAIGLMFLLTVFGVLGCLAIGGDDEKPTIYSDLQVKDYDHECAEHENAFVVLTNLAQRINSEMDRGGESFAWQNQASNDLWMAIFDKVANCKNYNPMRLSEEAMYYGEGISYELVLLLEFNRSNLCVRITSAAQYGHFDKATKWFVQDIGVGQLIRANCGNFMEYLIGRAFI